MTEFVRGMLVIYVHVMHIALCMCHALFTSLKLLQPHITIVLKLTMMAMINDINQESEAAMEGMIERTLGQGRAYRGVLFLCSGHQIE